MQTKYAHTDKRRAARSISSLGAPLCIYRMLIRQALYGMIGACLSAPYRAYRRAESRVGWWMDYDIAYAVYYVSPRGIKARCTLLEWRGNARFFDGLTLA